MGIIEKIKNFWRNRKTKTLPASADEARYIKTTNKLKQDLLRSNGNSYRKPTQLENDIERFINAYLNMTKQLNPNQPVNMEAVAYASLVTMNGTPVTQEELSNNGFYENNLLNKLSEEQIYAIMPQVGFYHIRQPDYIQPDDKDMVRVYLNCKNSNIAELSQALLNNNTNPNFYMKFTSNDKMAEDRYSRGEKMVIYCSKDELAYTEQLIEYTKSIRPDLFEESEKTLPFLQNYNNTVSLAIQPVSDQFVDLQGRTRIIARSANKFICNILKESYREAVNEIARCDSNINFLSSEKYVDDDYWHAKNAGYVNEHYHDYLMSSMIAKIEWLSRVNNIYIEGINYQQNKEIENQQEYEKY